MTHDSIGSIQCLLDVYKTGAHTTIIIIIIDDNISSNLKGDHIGIIF